MLLFKVLPFLLLAAGGLLVAESGSETAAGLLPIPPIIGGEQIRLRIQAGELELPMGSSRTLGFNGDYLGPTIRLRRGEVADIRLENSLAEDTTVHWHGLHVPAEFDGGPHQVIRAGSDWNPRFTISQPAATLWYHPHLMGKTAEHVYRGLAGLFIIDDEYSDSLNIPKEYGVDDIPLILQDRRFERDGSFRYAPFPPDIMHGYIGNAVLVNGAYEPLLKLDRGTYRFRLLNGSNSSIMRISFSSGQEFTVIASDGGFLPESVRTDRIILSPGERYEILADFDGTEQTSLVTEIYGGKTYETLKIDVTEKEGRFYDHPGSFRYRAVVPDKDSVRRSFRMETRGMGRFTINGRRMDMNTVNFSLMKNSREVWTIENVGMGMMNVPHSFHVHDVQFSVLSVNGAPPHPLYAGPKDTVLLFAGDRVEIALEFQEYTGLYMYHCHLLEHEDAGMMGQFLVE
jgi:FtsP/CotA-like multicopper oxidase with cupredoxin domain